MNTGIIYCYTNTITGKKYVGQTIHPNQRKYSHKYNALMRGSDYYFHRSIRKHGWEAFIYEVLEEHVQNLNEREDHYMEKYDSIWPNGYNQCSANSLDEVALKKMSDTMKRKWQEMSEEEKYHYMNIRSANFTMKGKKQTDHQKRRVTEARQAQWTITHPDGKSEIITNLNLFCRDMGWGRNGQSNLTRGRYKGYKASKLPIT